MTIELAETPTTEEQEVAEETTQETEETSTEEEKTTEEELVTETLTVDDIVSGKTPKKKSGTTPEWAQKRFDELTAKIYEKDKKIKELESEKAIPTDRPVPPVESDFMSPDDYRKARIKYEDDLEEYKGHHQRAREAQETRERNRSVHQETFDKNSARMRAKYADFDQAVNEPIFTPEMRDEIVESEFGPEIGYFLSKNVPEAMRMARLTPRELTREIAKLEFKFSSASKRSTTSAPEPLSTVRGSDVVDVDMSGIKSDDEWLKKYRQSKLKAIGGK